MTYETARSGIQAHLLTQWAILYPAWDVTQAGQIGFENHTFEPPDDLEGLRITIADGGADNASVGSPGSNIVRHSGVIIVEIYVPAKDTSSGHVGELRMRTLAEQVATTFMNKTIGTVRTYVPYRSGNREQTSHFVWNMAIPFQRDETNG